MSSMIVGAGLPLAGTGSLLAALEQLGVAPCMHMTSILKNNDNREPALFLAAWEAKKTGSPVEWGPVLDPYLGLVSAPGCFFIEELLKAYPAAKVILTTRDFDGWYASVKDCLAPTADPAAFRPAPHTTVLPLFKHIQLWYDMTRTVVWDGFMQGKFEDKEAVRKIVEAHVKHIKKVVPKKQLLELSPKDGWGPLCKFLGTPVPDVPFPQGESEEEMKAELAALSKFIRNASYGVPLVGAGVLSTALALVGGLSYALYRAWRRA
ncbi:hypothetical protein HYH03_001160 [Edaphochlamys debaryana]|uniref:NAD dependent epimerase/dehydratase n=1 Tax=Edaphochlamys debaryana TaxID=47281 RepID=A0A836C5Z9_9CHLO|nr:hypothetical protein HYH03_001160 [Edaphochlamys debaryana]|eukprot:KAG2501370.1 hypothetical protein HYH03_001160 [Edaphochlamys debaryana]